MAPRRDHTQVLAQQENPHGVFKTPGKALAGSSKPVGNPGLTVKGKVLGLKDGNQGGGLNIKQDIPKTPRQKKKLDQNHQAKQVTLPAVLPEHLQTPSPRIARFTSLRFSPSPEIQRALFTLQPEVEIDREIEYTAPSALEYDEPYSPQEWDAEAIEGAQNAARVFLDNSRSFPFDFVDEELEDVYARYHEQSIDLGDSFTISEPEEEITDDRAFPLPQLKPIFSSADIPQDRKLPSARLRSITGLESAAKRSTSALGKPVASSTTKQLPTRTASTSSMTTTRPGAPLETVVSTFRSRTALGTAPSTVFTTRSNQGPLSTVRPRTVLGTAPSTLSARSNTARTTVLRPSTAANQAPRTGVVSKSQTRPTTSLSRVKPISARDPVKETEMKKRMKEAELELGVFGVVDLAGKEYDLGGSRGLLDGFDTGSFDIIE